jgi:hypothetical protein
VAVIRRQKCGARATRLYGYSGRYTFKSGRAVRARFAANAISRPRFLGCERRVCPTRYCNGCCGARPPALSPGSTRGTKSGASASRAIHSVLLLRRALAHLIRSRQAAHDRLVHRPAMSSGVLRYLHLNVQSETVVRTAPACYRTLSPRGFGCSRELLLRLPLPHTFIHTRDLLGVEKRNDPWQRPRRMKRCTKVP